ncbi:pali-domain-containing protein [Tothia fuscella]|uniref:Pali-domain-containing protein n=1 Tax=Tothia fuscella TaxID=1048955 RepID=A0A9P4P1R7_9PEZI|nr:pali-domain-containing protein [Tothia fuscella]
MLRPATPLSILFFIAFVLLLLSTLSTPVIKGVPLASYKGTTYGVWGTCGPNGNCSKIEIGYDTSAIPNGPSTDFSISSSTRHSVSYILIVHPVAALLSLICFSLAVASHFHSPAHSPRFLLGLFILTIPTLLASLLAFLVDILLFIPHVGWGGWIVLVATIVIIIASLLTCGMRRTLVSRKARRKRIAENAEMSGENYYNKRVAEIATVGLPRAESPPPLSGGSVSPPTDKAATFGTAFDLKQTPSLDDRTPLNPSNNPSIRGEMSGMGYDESRRGTPSRVSPPRDQYGNIIPPNIKHQPSSGSVGSNGSSQLYARGGRGGYPPSRGGYPPRGGPQMRGAPSNMRGPSPGWNGNGRGRGGPMMAPGPMMGRGGGPPPVYGQERRFSGGGGSRNQSPMAYSMPRGMSPGGQREDPHSIGQAVELDEHSGIPSPTRQEMPADYMPPRAQWNGSRQGTPHGSRTNLSPIQASPIEPSQPPAHVRQPSVPDTYYEDVDPRFAEPSPPSMPLSSSNTGAIPNVLQAGGPRGPPMNNNAYLSPTHNPTGGQDLRALQDPSMESLQEGQRSPAASDASHFTSVSQRGVNPNWRPPPGQQQQQHPQQQRIRGPPRNEDVLLSHNPEFSLPGVGPANRGRGGFRGRGGSGMGPRGGGSLSGPMGGLGPASGGSRYPAP